MGQREFLHDLDASLHAAFAAAGMADYGQYTGPGATATVPCQVYVDRDIETLGSLRQFKAGRVEVGYVLTEGFRPEQKGRVVVDGETYINGDHLSDDGSLSRWLVRRASE